MKLLPIIELLFFTYLWGGGINVQIVKEPSGTYPKDHLVIRLQGLSNQTLPEIAPDDIKLTIGEETLDSFSIEPYVLSGKPVDLLFCVDISGSMYRNPITEVKQAINEFLKQLKPPIRIGLCAFGNEFYLLQPFTSNYESVRRKVQNLTAKENFTELHYGIYKAINLFEKFKSPPLRFLILFSDGKNEGSTAYTLEDCINEAINKQVMIFAVGYTRVNPVYLKNLEKIANFTAGAYQHPRERQDIIQAFKKIKSNIMSFYIIQYNLEAEPGGLNGPLSIEIVTANETLRTITERVIATPKKFSIWTIVGILIIFLSTIGIAIWVYFRKEQDIEAVEREAKDKEWWYEEELKKFRKNLDYIGKILNRKEKVAGEPDDIYRTLILEKGFLPVCILHPEGQKPIIIDNYPVKIGKTSSCQVQIKNPKISREHALIDHQEGQIVVVDLNSTNGVWLNGKKVHKAFLNNGDILSLGPIGYKVELIKY